MAATRLELNLMRLLSRCEALAAERRDPEERRLEKVRRGPAFLLGWDWLGKALGLQQHDSVTRSKQR